MKEKFVWVLIILIAIPLIIWLTMMPLVDRFGSLSLTFLSLGRLFGLIGMSLFSVNIILTTRLRFLDDLFGGLNKIYLNHHLIGAVAFILLLLHPLTLALNLAIFSPQSAISFLLFSPGRPDLFFGKIALLLMTVLLVITFYLNFSYQKWKGTHKFLGLALALAVIHIFLVSGDLSQSPLLKFYLSFLNFTALAAFFYRSVFGQKLVSRFIYSVVGVKELAPGIFEMELKAEKKPMSFFPGQFIFLKIFDPSISEEEHPFSVSSSPQETNLKLTFKVFGLYTQKLKNLKKGAKALIEGPFGKFSYKFYPKKEQIWIAGGIGIAPFLSMSRDLVSSAGQKISLFYSTKEPAEKIYMDELKEMANLKPNFRFFPYESKILGRLTADYVSKQLKNFIDLEIFICGPKEMLISLRNQFRQKGVPDSKIHSEEFEF